MRLIHKLLQALNQFRQRYLDLSSLRFRLTVEIAVLAILGLGSLALWTSWKMQDILIESHKQSIGYIAAYVPHTVEVYSKTSSIEMGIQRTIADVSVPDLMMWVKRPDGEMLAQSVSLHTTSPVVPELLSVPELPSKPEVRRVNDRYLVLCKTPLIVRGQEVGNVYLAHDVTEQKYQLINGLRSLAVVSSLVILVTIIAIATQLHRSLQPLQQMSQLARAISADDLTATRLQVGDVPSEIKGLVYAFNTMLFRLSEVWEQQRQFVGNVSHELRTPLTVIHGYLQSILRRSTNLNDYQQEALSTVATEARRTVQLLQDLLDLARADSGHLHFWLEPIVLNDLVADVAAMAEKVSNRRISVLATSEVIGMADWDRLKQVLINLVDNAVKYSEPDQPIDLILEQTDRQAKIHVCDRGVGIPLQHQSRIFERFYQVDESRNCTKEGTGLGLAIVKTLVEGMEGQITLRSKPGEGSVFTICLPVNDP